ncbi:MAG TPA: hypothetical protein VN493_00895 [Thermoanaerobaculia bacterium]|nr:hypothetical protein [Thermoanaerobaculia bacterium]
MWRLRSIRNFPILGLILAAWLLAALAAEAQQCPTSESAPQALAPVTLFGSNNQYLRYNNQTIPLIGLSSEYLCHVAQPGTAFGGTVTPDQAYCTWANYKAFINRLQQSGLNVLRLWVGLNHSPGRERGIGGPYPNEQPFVFNSVTGLWDLNSPDPVYWERLKCVIGYAGTKDVIVELTLFDPWSGNWTTGPWHSSRNSQGIGFSAERFFARFVNDPTKNDDMTNTPIRQEQLDLVQHAVQQLNAYPNLIWELANEADLPWSSSAAPAGAEAARWMDRIAQIVQQEEALPGRLQHLIEVNFHTQTAINQLLAPGTNPSLAGADVVAAHYVTVEPAKGDYGAIELIRAKHGTSGFTTRAFGFNETRSTPTPSIPSSARSEAWEFALNEGGLYDNYNLQFRNASGVVHADTNKVFNQLGVLKSFLLGLTGGIGAMSRDACGAGCWLTGQGPYKNLEATTCTRPDSTIWRGSKYWAAMHSANAYVAYFHHSVDTASPSNAFSRYEPPPAGCPVSYQETGTQFKPDVLGTYIAEWMNPVSGAVLASHNLGSVGAGVTVNVPSSPTYVYDIALRVRKQ